MNLVKNFLFTIIFPNTYNFDLKGMLKVNFLHLLKFNKSISY